MRKIAIITFAAIIIIFSALILFKNTIAKLALSGGVKALTGLSMSVDSVNLGLADSSLDIKGLKLFNPENFTDRVMADLPQIYIKYDLWGLLRNKIHLNALRINLRRLTVVKNEEKKLNLDALKPVGGPASGKAKPQEAAPAGKKKPAASRFQIDLLELKISEVIYKDYSGGTPPKMIEFKASVNLRRKNITDPSLVVATIVSQALINTTIDDLVNFQLDNLRQKAIGAVGKVAGGVTDKAMDTAGEAVGTVFDTGKEIIKKILPVKN